MLDIVQWRDPHLQQESFGFYTTYCSPQPQAALRKSSIDSSSIR